MIETANMATVGKAEAPAEAPATTLRHYLGVKILQAEPMTAAEFANHRQHPYAAEDEHREGYRVVYPDGYESWSPKEVFEAAYLPLTDPTRITPTEIEAFRGEGRTLTLGPKTTLYQETVLSGYEFTEASSCVDPANYDEELGGSICRLRVGNHLWPLLGFVLQWGRNGLRRAGVPKP